jgi:hypothetical protein
MQNIRGSELPERERGAAYLWIGFEKLRHHKMEESGFFIATLDIHELQQGIELEAPGSPSKGAPIQVVADCQNHLQDLHKAPARLQLVTCLLQELQILLSLFHVPQTFSTKFQIEWKSKLHKPHVMNPIAIHL